MSDRASSDDLLAWYDRHAREMPWRISPKDRKKGIKPDPYHIWLSEVMLQQTTVAAVKAYFLKFIELWPTIQHLAYAEDADVMAAWAGLGYYARARNLLKCARVVTFEHGGVFPTERTALEALPGIGPYTSAAIASIAFDQSETVVDGNVERVIARLHCIEIPMPTSKPQLVALAQTLTPKERAGDYAQAVMDLGATICTARNPACGICPWRAPCRARIEGIAAELPRKLPKQAKPTRYGTAFVSRLPNGAWILERRPEKGLLGGMLGWPGSDWAEQPATTLPFAADWQDTEIEVRHTFTHFHLRLKVFAATVTAASEPAGTIAISSDNFRPSDLPTVMRKVFNAAKHRF